jgi:hypothetical protein
MRFAQGLNTFEVAPNFSLRALQELHIEFDAKAPDQRVDPTTVDAKSDATEVPPP